MAEEFEYKAKNKDGDLISGTIEAESKSAIARQLREKGLSLIHI